MFAGNQHSLPPAWVPLPRGPWARMSGSPEAPLSPASLSSRCLPLPASHSQQPPGSQVPSSLPVPPIGRKAHLCPSPPPPPLTAAHSEVSTAEHCLFPVPVPISLPSCPAPPFKDGPFWAQGASPPRAPLFSLSRAPPILACPLLRGPGEAGTGLFAAVSPHPPGGTAAVGGGWWCWKGFGSSAPHHGA